MIDNNKGITLECDCHTHRVDFEVDEGGFFYNIFWYVYPVKETFLERIKMAWHILKHGDAMSMDIVLRKKEMGRLKKWLNTFNDI